MTDEQLQIHFREHRAKLVGYVTSRVKDRDLAEDIVQEGLLKAMKMAPELREDDKVIPWFYRILQNAIIDQYRKDTRAAKREEAYALDQETISAEEHTSVCECFKALMPALKPEYSEIIESLDLRQEDPDLVAERLGVTRNNLKVRAHRARQQLRTRLEETCQMCAKHGCLNCSCIH